MSRWSEDFQPSHIKHLAGPTGLRASEMAAEELGSGTVTVTTEFAFMPIMHGKEVVKNEDGTTRTIHKSYGVPINVMN